MKENTIMNYKQIWKHSIETQLEKHYLNLYMQQMIREKDNLKKEEIMLHILQEFGSHKVQNYLETASEEVYEEFSYVMTEITGSREGSQKQILSNRNTWSKTNVIDENTDVMTGNLERDNTMDSVQYSLLQHKLILAEYQKAENFMIEILNSSKESTRNVLLGKVEEYKKLFYEYIKGTVERKEINHSILKNSNKKNNNLKIFTDYELEVLEDIFKKKLHTEEAVLFEKKLNFIVMKKVTEHLLQEDRKRVETDYLKRIYKTLEQVLSVTDKMEQQKYEIEIKKSHELEVDFTKRYGEKEYKNGKASKIRIGRNNKKGQLWLSFQLLDRLSNAKIENKNSIDEFQLLNNKVQGRKTDEENRTKLGLFFKSSDIKTVFEIGSLAERKLMYLALENNIDNIIMQRNQLKQENVLEHFIQIKKEIIQEADAVKRAAGEWRFLMTKEKSEKICQAVAGLQQEEKLLLEKMVQKSVEEFYYAAENYVGQKRSAVNVDKQYLWEEWNVFFQKEEIEKFYEIASKQKGRVKHLSMMPQSKNKIIEKSVYKIIKKVHDNAKTKEKEAEKRQLKLTEEKLYISDVIHIFETGSLIERKLAYLALQNAFSYEENKKEDLFQAFSVIKMPKYIQNIIIQNADMLQTSDGDWSFLLNKEKAGTIINVLSNFQKNEKEFVEERITKYMKNFYTFINEKEMQKIEKEEKWKERKQDEKKQNERDKEVYDRIRTYDTDSIRDRQQQLWEEWKNFFQQEEIEVLTEKMFTRNNISEQEKVLHIFSEGRLPERKLVYLSIKNFMDAVIMEKSSHPDLWKERENAVLAKKQVIKEEDIPQISGGDWTFLLNKERSREIIDTLRVLEDNMKKNIFHTIQQNINDFYQGYQRKTYQKEFDEEKRNLIKGSQNVKEITSQIRQVWETYFSDDEKSILQHYNILRRVDCSEKKEEKDSFVNSMNMLIRLEMVHKKSKNVNRKIKNYQRDHKILHNTQSKKQKTQEMMSNIFFITDFGDNSLDYHMEERRQLHEFSKQLQKNTNVFMEEHSISKSFLTRKNKDFMRPPIEQNDIVAHTENSKFLMSKNMKYHEESIKLILNNSKDKKEIEEVYQKRTKAMEQEKILQELEGNLLDYKVELENKTQRLEVVEQQLKKQEKNIEFLKEAQNSITGKQNKKSEINRLMNQLKGELQLERIRSGKM